MNVRAKSSRAVRPRAFGRPSADAVPPIALDRLHQSISKAKGALLSDQSPAGYWNGGNEGPPILAADYILLRAFTEQLGDPRLSAFARLLLDQRASDGGWGDLDTSVRAYFALKIAGHSVHSDELARARISILDAGGAERSGTLTYLFLAALGQVPYARCPSVPPELVLAPTWLPGSLATVPAAARPIFVPIAILSATRRVTELPSYMGIGELFRVSPARSRPIRSEASARLISLENLFALLDRLYKAYERFAPARYRARALEAAEGWMLERFEASDGLGGWITPTLLCRMALRALGHADESPECQWAEQSLGALVDETGDGVWIAPSRSPVRDTALAIGALAEADDAADPGPLDRAARWLLERESTDPSDVSEPSNEIERSGWACQFENRFYPEIESTAMALSALSPTSAFDEPAAQQALHRAICALLGLQSRNRHGWATYEKDRGRCVLGATRFGDLAPFADPVRVDVTARVLETFGRLGYRRGKVFIDDAVAFLFRRQHADGYWATGPSADRIHDTWRVLACLSAIKYDARHPRVRKSVEWLLAHQLPHGPWPLPDQAEPSVVRTAWAVLALVAAGDADLGAVRKGIRFLLEAQSAEGHWHDRLTTDALPMPMPAVRQAGQPLVCAMLALARYRNATGATDTSTARRAG